MSKTVQHFSEEYLDYCRAMTPDQIVRFLDDFRRLHGCSTHRPKSRLISLKVPEDLLSLFRQKAQLTGTPYQTQIKKLMHDWLTLADSE